MSANLYVVMLSVTFTQSHFGSTGSTAFCRSVVTVAREMATSERWRVSILGDVSDLLRCGGVLELSGDMEGLFPTRG